MCSENLLPSSEPYLIPNAANISPSAVIPKPVLLPCSHLVLIFFQRLSSVCFISSDSGSFWILVIILFTFSISRSIKSSINLWATIPCSINNSKSNDASSVNGLLTYEYKLSAINLQESFGHNGISPQGFVDTVLKPKSA